MNENESEAENEESKGSIIIESCVIKDIEFENGGVINVDGISIYLKRSEFSNIVRNMGNGSIFYGMVNERKEFIMKGCSLINCSCVGGDSCGGALYVKIKKGGNFVVNGSLDRFNTFLSCSCSRNGGSIYLEVKSGCNVNDGIYWISNSFYFGKYASFLECRSEYGKYIFVNSPSLSSVVSKWNFAFDIGEEDLYLLNGCERGKEDIIIPLLRIMLGKKCLSGGEFSCESGCEMKNGICMEEEGEVEEIPIWDGLSVYVSNVSRGRGTCLSIDDTCDNMLLGYSLMNKSERTIRVIGSVRIPIGFFFGAEKNDYIVGSDDWNGNERVVENLFSDEKGIVEYLLVQSISFANGLSFVDILFRGVSRNESIFSFSHGKLSFIGCKLGNWSYVGLIGLIHMEGNGSLRISGCVFEKMISYSGGSVLKTSEYWEGRIGIKDDVFRNCSTSGGHGGMMCLYGPGKCKIERCYFKNSSSEAGCGGCIDMLICLLEIENSKFENSTCGNHGGCIYGVFCMLRIMNCLFICCSSLKFGGSMYLDSVKGDLINCTFYMSTSFYGGGGGMYIVEAEGLTLEWCAFKLCVVDISRQSYGGGIMYEGSKYKSLIVHNSVFLSSYATYEGADIFLRSSYSTIIDGSLLKSNLVGYNVLEEFDIGELDFVFEKAAEKEGGEVWVGTHPLEDVWPCGMKEKECRNSTYGASALGVRKEGVINVGEGIFNEEGMIFNGVNRMIIGSGIERMNTTIIFNGDWRICNMIVTYGDLEVKR
jgi:hypothetical protein